MFYEYTAYMGQRGNASLNIFELKQVPIESYDFNLINKEVNKWPVN